MSANAVPPSASKIEKGDKNVSVNKRPSWAVKQDALRQKALEQKLKGVKSAQGKVAELGKGQYVELEREGTDKIFVILAEFGDTRHSAFPDTTVGWRARQRRTALRRAAA